jgi:7-cyano-7-deazaguanine synthase
MSRAYVLLSGGIDSGTCLHVAHAQFDDVHAISIDYGQRHKKEIAAAKKLADGLGVPHRTLDLSAIVPSTMLTNANVEVPNISYSDIQGVSPTYVPFRNGLMLSAISSYVAGKRVVAEKNNISGQALREWGIFFGAHAEDAQNWAYPDCTPEFIGAMANAIYVGTYRAVRLHTPLEWLSKKEIILLGDTLGVPWALTWSCYKGEEEHCGVCPTCRARRLGFQDAGVPDPTIYRERPEC